MNKGVAVMRSVPAVVLVVFLCAFSAFGAPPGEGWTLAKEGEGIEVYTRPVQGMDAKEFMGITEVDAPMEVVLEVFRDIPSFPEWYGFCRDIEVLEDYSESHKLVYFVLATQWPTKDRDMVIDAVIDVDRAGGESVITMKALEEEVVPRVRKYVRMTCMVGQSTLTEVSGGKTRVVYRVRSDPGGYIPSALSNLLAKDQPYLTLKGLKEMVKDEVYHERAGLRK